MSERLMDAIWAGLSLAVVTVLLLALVLGAAAMLWAIHPLAGVVGTIGIVVGVSYGVSVYVDGR